MSVEVIDHKGIPIPGHTVDEQSVQFTTDEDDKGAIQSFRIHPWHRRLGTSYEDHSVYVEIGWDDEEQDLMQNAIVNLEDFVEGILAVFPELKRAHE